MMCIFGVLYNGFNDSMQRRTWCGRITETYLILTLCYLFYEDFMYIYIFFLPVYYAVYLYYILLLLFDNIKMYFACLTEYIYFRTFMSWEFFLRGTRREKIIQVKWKLYEVLFLGTFFFVFNGNTFPNAWLWLYKYMCNFSY